MRICEVLIINSYGVKKFKNIAIQSGIIIDSKSLTDSDGFKTDIMS
jgi:hypothetical protein